MTQEKENKEMNQDAMRFICRVEAVRLLLQCGNTRMADMNFNAKDNIVVFDALFNGYDMFAVVVGGTFVPLIHMRITVSEDGLVFDAWPYAVQSAVPEKYRDERRDILFFDKQDKSVARETVYSIKVPDDERARVIKLLPALCDVDSMVSIRWNEGRPSMHVAAPAYMADPDQRKYSALFDGVHKALANALAVVGHLLYSAIVDPSFDVALGLAKMLADTTDVIAEKALCCPFLLDEHKAVLQDRLEHPRKLTDDDKFSETVVAAIEHWQKVRMSRDAVPAGLDVDAVALAVTRMDEGVDGRDEDEFADMDEQQKTIAKARQQMANTLASAAHTYMFTTL